MLHAVSLVTGAATDEACAHLTTWFEAHAKEAASVLQGTLEHSDRSMALSSRATACIRLTRPHTRIASTALRGTGAAPRLGDVGNGSCTCRCTRGLARLRACRAWQHRNGIACGSRVHAAWGDRREGEESCYGPMALLPCGLALLIDGSGTGNVEDGKLRRCSDACAMISAL